MKLVIAAISALTIVPLAAAPVLAQQAPGQSIAAPIASLTVSGEGRVDASPDMAVVSVGVTTIGETAAEALAANSAQVATLLAALEAMGIAARDIQTSQLNLNPLYDNKAMSEGRSEITGYQVSNMVTVRVRALDSLGAVLDQLVSQGANQLNGLTFGLSAPEPLQDQARERAVAEAVRKAELLARAAGVSLGRIVSITEGGSYQNPQPMFSRDAAMAVPVAGGEVSVEATVSIVFELAAE